MRVLQMNSADDWGGGEAHTLMLAQGICAHGSEVTLACRPGSAIAERFHDAGLPTLLLPLREGLDCASIWQVAQYCRAHGIDIIHAHLARDYTIAALASRLCPSTRVVLTRHLLFPLCIFLLQRFVVKRASAFIAVSEAVRAVLEQESGVPAERIATIYNGIDTARFASAPMGVLREELSLDAETPLIGVVGQITPHKGLDIFLRAIPQITAAFPNVHFVISGNAQRELHLLELRRLEEQLEIANCSWLLGRRSNIPEVMKDLSILVMPSQGEAFGLVLAEAMAAGTPVIATNIGGAREIINDGKSGVLIALNDPDELAAAVIDLLAHPEKRKQLSHAGQRHVNAQFGIEAMIERTMALYRDVIGSPRQNLARSEER